MSTVLLYRTIYSVYSVHIFCIYAIYQWYIQIYHWYIAWFMENSHCWCQAAWLRHNKETLGWPYATSHAPFGNSHVLISSVLSFHFISFPPSPLDLLLSLQPTGNNPGMTNWFITAADRLQLWLVLGNTF